MHLSTLVLIFSLASLLGSVSAASPVGHTFVEATKAVGFPKIDTFAERAHALSPLPTLRSTKKPRDSRAIRGVVLPEVSESGSFALRSFDEAAVKAIRATHEDDHDDPAVLLSLQAKLQSEVGLAPVRRAWGTLLERTIERAKALEQVRGPIRQLRLAFEGASFDDTYGVYRDVDIGQCLQATNKALESLGPGHKLGLTLSSVGHHKLSTLKTLCEQALQLALAQSRFPRKLGPLKERAEVAKAYRRFSPSQQVLKISVPHSWKRKSGEMELEAVVGVEYSSTEQGFTCALIELTMTQRLPPTTQTAPSCCTMRKISPIACTELRH